MSFGSSSRHLNPLYWVGYWIRAGAHRIAQEAQYLGRQVSESSSHQRSAWIIRFVVSTALVAADWWFMTWSVQLDTLPALGVSILVLLVLPKPTPRIPLVACRLIFAGTMAGCIRAGIKWALDAFPTIQSWKVPMQVLWFLIFSGLVLWAFSALFRRSGVAATVSTGSKGNVSNANWSAVPTSTFQSIGGSKRAKDEVRLIAANSFERRKHGVVRNGVLLYGPQGTGKNLLAEATAGEFRVNFYHVRCPQLLGTIIGSTTAEIRRVFEWAAQHRPIVVFLDEIDSVGSKKATHGGGDTGGAGREYNTIVTELMQSIDQYRNMDGLLIMAATNHLDSLEPTLIRDGRFDLKLRVDLPSDEERGEILGTLLRQHRWRSHDLAPLARRTPGWSPARLKGLVDRAVLLAGNAAVEEGHLLAALEGTGGHDRPNIETVTWDDVVLPEPTVRDLQALLRLMIPGEAERLSLPAPSGLILIGAPGTGKTLTAKLIACQSRRSFYAVSPSDVLSGAMGGSVKRLSEIFVRAKENAPSVLFFDEMDGLFPHIYSAGGQHDVQLVEQALIEISALRSEHGVFLIGTTNYIDRIDPRILRGGRFSEKIEVTVPDDTGYRKLIGQYLGRARLASGVTLDLLVDRIRGISPADLEATIVAMKRAAMRRMKSASDELPPLLAEDLEEALGRVQPRF